MFFKTTFLLYPTLLIVFCTLKLVFCWLAGQIITKIVANQPLEVGIEKLTTRL